MCVCFLCVYAHTHTHTHTHKHILKIPLYADCILKIFYGADFRDFFFRARVPDPGTVQRAHSTSPSMHTGVSS